MLDTLLDIVARLKVLTNSSAVDAGLDPEWRKKALVSDPKLIE